MFQFSIGITRKRILVLILAIISVMLIDSTLVKYIAYSNEELSRHTYIGIFITFVIFFVGISLVTFGFIERKEEDPKRKRGLALKNSYHIIFLTQLSLIVLFAIIIYSVVVLQSYSILSLFAALYISHIPALFFLMFLVLSLVEWIMVKKNRILLLYSLSFSLTALTIIISLMYATIVLAHQESIVKPYPIHTSLYDLPRADLAIYFGPTLDIISILSFISVWIVSAFLLSTYIRRMGKVRYCMIILLPLMYFLFPFETYFLNIFQPLMTSSPVTFAIINGLVLGATKQVGALFFSIAFLIASGLVAKHVVHKYLLISALGIAILFGSLEIDSFLYATYPPFGLVTMSFMAMGSYLTYTGITNTAALVARDKELRKEFYRSAMSEFDLLKVIGVSEMEKELMKSYKAIDKRTRPLQKDSSFEKDNVKEALHGLVDEMDTENAREILHDVLTEVYKKSRPKSKY